jgi:oligopeptide transport system substrate-binding protein
MKPKRLGRAAATALLALATVAADAETVLRRGHYAEPETLDPHKTDGAFEMAIEDDMFEGAVRLDPEGKVVPGLAERWEVSADGLLWTFHLRPNLVWSDGSPLTAEDFVWSLRRALAPETASPVAEELYPIADAQAFNEGREKDPAAIGVSAPDPSTLRIRLTHPTAYLPGIMALTVAVPLQRRSVEAAGGDWARPGSMISNGAYVLKKWTPQLEIELVRNPRYWDAGSVKIDRVRWMTVEDKETSLRLYRNGELEIAQVSPQDVRRLRLERPQELRTDPILRTDYLVVNMRVKGLDDVRVRRALAMAIDRDAIAYKINPHGQTPAGGLVPPGIPGYVQQSPDWAAWPMAARVAEAKALLAEAGYDAGHPFRVEAAYPSNEEYRLTMAAIQGMWQRIGVVATLQSEELQVLNAALRDMEHEIAYTDWIADYADPQTFLSMLDSHAGSENNSDFRNPRYDALMAQAANTTDPEARMKVLAEAESLLNEDAPVIPITFEATPILLSPRVRGYVGNPLDQNLSRDLWIGE